MDRPEWTAVNPANGEVYITCTENPDRGNTGSSSNNNPNPALDAANPRYWLDNKGVTAQNATAQVQKGNVNGHIMRLRESGDDASATSFGWDIFLFGAQARADAGLDDANYQKNVNLSGLSDFNDLSKPDGCWFSRASGVLWIETDDNAYYDVTNCMLLAAIPGTVGDGAKLDVVNKANGSPNAAVTSDVTVSTRMGKKLGDTKFKRFLTAPKGSEVTGLAESPDGKVLFINIQHPGENTTTAQYAAGTFESNWPGNGKGVAAYGPGGAGARPRSATVMRN
jgi:secreted PhoX family phosphatase